MSRIQGRFESLQASRRKALIPYIVAGDPAPALTVPLMRARLLARPPLTSPFRAS